MKVWYRGAVLRWLRARSPRFVLLTSWIVFGLSSYPGYMSVDSALQLFAVRNGVYTDGHPTVMTGIWSILEILFAGPAPMLALQSALFLFGLYALLRRVLSERAAALTAGGILMFPPVFAPMAVIWPDPLLAGALVAGTACVLASQLRIRIAGCVLFVVALGCRPEIAFALIPLVLLAVRHELPTISRLMRAGITVGLVLVLVLVARVADWALTDTKTYAWEQTVVETDIASILRRARIPTDPEIDRVLAGVPIANVDGAYDRLRRGRDALDGFPLSHGDKRVFEPIANDDQADAVTSAWRRLILRYPGAYLKHRQVMTKYLLGFGDAWSPVYQDFGDPELLAPLHHRATPSTWQEVTQAIVSTTAKTPLFWPWLYLVLALALLAYLARKEPMLRALATSGFIYEVTWFFVAPGADYRYSHWLVATTTVAGMALLVRRRWPVKPA